MWTKAVAVALLLSALFVGCTSRGSDLSSGSLPDRGKAVVAHLVDGDFSGVRATFNSNMMTALSETGLRNGWNRVVAQYGSFSSMGTPTIVERAAVTIVRIPLTMSKGAAEARITFDTAGAIAGLFVLRPEVPL